jgi:hypothetical protein
MAAEQGVTLPVWRAALALLHATLGRTDAARQELSDLGKAEYRDLPRDGNLLATYANLAQLCALLDAPSFAEPLVPLIAPHVDAVIVPAFAAGCLGSAARYAGLLAQTLGRPEEATAYFEAALATNERIGALPLLAHTQRELASILRARGARGDRDRASTLEAAAAATAARLGLVGLQRRLAADTGEPRTEFRPSSAPGAARRIARLRHEGDIWTVACEGELTRIKDMRGIAHLVELIRHPGHEFHALDLGGAGDLRTGDAGETLDADARRAYKARLGELRDELQEAEEFHDIGRVARLREEMEMLAGELRRERARWAHPQGEFRRRAGTPQRQPRRAQGRAQDPGEVPRPRPAPRPLRADGSLLRLRARPDVPGRLGAVAASKGVAEVHEVRGAHWMTLILAATLQPGQGDHPSRLRDGR